MVCRRFTSIPTGTNKFHSLFTLPVRVLVGFRESWVDTTFRYRVRRVMVVIHLSLSSSRSIDRGTVLNYGNLSRPSGPEWL